MEKMNNICQCCAMIMKEEDHGKNEKGFPHIEKVEAELNRFAWCSSVNQVLEST